MSNKIYSSNPAVDQLKRTGASGKFLIMVILMTISVVTTIFTSTSTGYLFESLMPSVAGFESFFETYIHDFTAYSLIGAIILAIPQLLVVIGYWMFHASSRNTQDGRVATGGITMVRVIRIIEFVIMIIGFVVSLAVVGIGIFAAALGNMDMAPYVNYGGYSIHPSTLTVAFVVVLIAMAIIMTLVIIYYASILKILKRAKTIAETGVPDNRVSSFVIIMKWVSAIITIMGAIIAVFSAPISAIALAITGIATLLSAILLSEYKKGMTAVLYGIDPTAAREQQEAQMNSFADAQYNAAPVVPTPTAPVAPAIQQTEAEVQATVADHVNEIKEQASESVENAAEAVSEKVEDVKETATDAVTDAASAVELKVEDITNPDKPE